MNNIHPAIYEQRIRDADAVLQEAFAPETPRERALVVRIERARDLLNGTSPDEQGENGANLSRA